MKKIKIISKQNKVIKYNRINFYFIFFELSLNYLRKIKYYLDYYLIYVKIIQN
jgi:hypothetical protein